MKTFCKLLEALHAPSATATPWHSAMHLLMYCTVPSALQTGLIAVGQPLAQSIAAWAPADAGQLHQLQSFKYVRCYLRRCSACASGNTEDLVFIFIRNRRSTSGASPSAGHSPDKHRNTTRNSTTICMINKGIFLGLLVSQERQPTEFKHANFYLRWTSLNAFKPLLLLPNRKQLSSRACVTSPGRRRLRLATTHSECTSLTVGEREVNRGPSEIGRTGRWIVVLRKRWEVLSDQW